MKRNALWLLIGNGGYATTQLLSIVIISKTLGVKDLGLFSLGLALTAPIMMFSNFGTRVLWVTDATGGLNYFQFRFTRFLSSISGFVVCFFFLLFYLDDTNHLLILLFIALSKVVESNADIYYADLHKQGDQKRICISMLSRGLMGILGMSIGCFLFNDLFIGVLCYSLCWLVSFIITDIFFGDPLKDNEFLLPSKNQIVWLAKQGSPLAISLFLVNINLNIPRIALESQHGLEAIGIFSALYFFIQTGSIVINSIGQLILPKLSKFYDRGLYDKHLQMIIKSFLIVFVFSSCGMLFCYLYGELLLLYLYDKSVSMYSNLLFLFFLLSPFQYLVSIMNPAISSTKKNVYLIWCQLLMFISILITALILVPTFDIAGAYYSTVVSSFIVLILYFFMYRKILRCAKNGV